MALSKNKDKIACPLCRNEPFTTVEAHPLLKQHLARLTIKCENEALGCTEKISYSKIEKHRRECGFVEMICQNYGCDKKILRKDFAEHELTCDFRINRCEKCDAKMKKDGKNVDGSEHDCFLTLRKRTEHLEAMVLVLNDRLGGGQNEKPAGYI